MFWKKQWVGSNKATQECDLVNLLTEREDYNSM